MNEVTTKTMTTKEVAAVLGITPKAVREVAKRCIPMKVFENGKQTYWTEAEVTVLIESMKNNSYTVAQTKESNLYRCRTGLTTVFKTEKAMDDFFDAIEDLPQEQYEGALDTMTMMMTRMTNQLKREHEELKKVNARLLEEQSRTSNLLIELNESKEWYSVKRMESLNPGKTFNWRDLKRVSNDMGCEIKEVFDQNYGTVNAYHVSVWEELYFDTLNYGD